MWAFKLNNDDEDDIELLPKMAKRRRVIISFRDRYPRGLIIIIIYIFHVLLCVIIVIATRPYFFSSSLNTGRD